MMRASAAVDVLADPNPKEEEEEDSKRLKTIVYPESKKLSLEFLVEVIKIDHEFVQKVAAILQSQEITTVGTLVSLLEDKLEKIGLSMGSVIAILKFIESQPHMLEISLLMLQ